MAAAASRCRCVTAAASAFYAPGPDVIQLPFPEAFTDAESYAATKAHELTH